VNSTFDGAEGNGKFRVQMEEESAAWRFMDYYQLSFSYNRAIGMVETRPSPELLGWR